MTGKEAAMRIGFIFARTSWLAVAAFAAVSMMNPKVAPASQKVISVTNASHNIEDFRRYAELAARLKPYGEVQITVSALAEKSWYEIPAGGSPWHEFICYKVAPWKYFPHPQIAPFIPADHVAANRRLLEAKLKVIRELGLMAVFNGVSSHILPETFFQAYPELRGPRVDHPRRTTREEFSMCYDLPETREMVSWMVAEIKRNVPEMKTWVTKTNDAGSGLCWATAQYPGPNGPMYCRHLSAGERVRNLSLAEHEGARRGGGDMAILWNSANFWREDEQSVRDNLPENTYFSLPGKSASFGMMLGQVYPFKGLFSPAQVIASMARFPEAQNVSLSYTAMYDRADDLPESIGKMIDLMDDCVAEPAVTDGEQMAKLRKFAIRWGGEANAEAVVKAFTLMDSAFVLYRSAAPRYRESPGVSIRHINRPLVIKPELLTAEEESYFLPYVFNPRRNEARMDYIDATGSRMGGTETWEHPPMWRAWAVAREAGAMLMNLKGAPEGEWLGKVGRSLSMWTCQARSLHNFYHAQLIRDKYKEILNGPKRIPAKVVSWDGDPGFQEWNRIMRNEFDNTNELIKYLRDGGIELVAHAVDQRYEDTFLLGPDLIGQLEKKVKIMREHWLDVQDYLAPPHK